MSPLMAQSGHPDRVGECPLSGEKRTLKIKSVTSAFDPKRTLEWALNVRLLDRYDVVT